MRDRIWSHAACLAVAAGWLAAAPVQAEQDRPIMLVVGGGVSWDSNFFRVPNDVARSERITTVSVGLSIDKVYAQQEVRLLVTKVFQRYENFSYLNFNPLNVDAAWQWHLSPRVSGSLTFARNQSLNKFEDTRDFTQRNIRTSGSGALTLDGQLSGGWHLLMSVPLSSQINSQVFSAEQSYREAGITPGIRYIWPSGNSLTFNQTVLRGKFVDQSLDPVNQLDTGYRNYLSDFLAEWRLNGKSSISGRLGWLIRNYDNFADRNFSGIVGRLAYTWTPTAKLTFTAAAERDLGYYQDSCSSYRVTDSITLGSSWQTTAKTSLQASVNWSPTDYEGPISTCASPLRRDKSRSAQLGASWTPLRNASISASLAYQRQSSNYPGQTWNDRIGQITASIRF